LIPPRRGQQAKASLFQQGGRLTQKGVGFIGVQFNADGLSGLKAAQQGREEPGGIAQPRQQLFLGLFKPFAQLGQDIAAQPPDLFGRHHQ